MRERPPFSPRECSPYISVDALFTPTSWIWPTHTVKIIKWAGRGQGSFAVHGKDFFLLRPLPFFPSFPFPLTS